MNLQTSPVDRLDDTSMASRAATIKHLLTYADQLEIILRYQVEPTLRGVDRDLAARVYSLRQQIKLCGIVLGGGHA
ncbi:hypothetical protein DNK06_08835 [Pseudomonas daroniae]|uniref:Uncharacterized protein n=1 Tax=Phytopseudomonas daroniae TaxID=2487519 RepID=A0A4Q9QPG9_9GAMM|nr:MULTISPECIES: hypothetical protein [Pseudomonas]TBU81205.1 hypothetical protein DNK06_08835 [Pseudomonas daroniae]TBU83729.1 hypothetical protein DNK31_09600 [Pseudomonas sp. FRB 228]TBU89337.1 hypothetical protein DNJ99_16520 [Pseudomonas daroniae]